MINLKNLTAGYSRRKPVLKELDSELHAGQIYGLLGANGSVKPPYSTQSLAYSIHSKEM